MCQLQLHGWSRRGLLTIAALLFTMEANSNVKKNLSCTSVPCYWLPPTSKNVPFSEICDIDFTAPQTKKKDRGTIGQSRRFYYMLY